MNKPAISDAATPYAVLAGQWRYRSFLNVRPPAEKLADLLFGEGLLDMRPDANGLITAGQLSFGDGFPMRFTGQALAPFPGCANVPPLSLDATAFGVAGTQTECWVYAYRGWLLPTWPFGTNAMPVLAGTVVRVVAHGPQSPAGVVASFVAVKF
ncbi:hypothetical protein [Hymenobacter ruricola]|uniref:Lipocalin-like domain-containing protein n=1 Tax=Hymenobacter ruricola TaxID=2791023 RepID=A0ABS0I3B2_9BACT|nr:hypothetical protein [Hymenobacter ruricola]MBF9221442.1 hypothetical protein [Hymenobacter ruricola]